MRYIKKKTIGKKYVRPRRRRLSQASNKSKKKSSGRRLVAKGRSKMKRLPIHSAPRPQNPMKKRSFIRLSAPKSRYY